MFFFFFLGSSVLSQLFSFSPLLRTLCRRPCAETGSEWCGATKKGNNIIVCGVPICPIPLRPLFNVLFHKTTVKDRTYMQRSSSPPFEFVFVFLVFIYLFFFFLFFCLYVDSPRRSGGPPAACPLLIYRCVLHTETLSSVH